MTDRSREQRNRRQLRLIGSENVTVVESCGLAEGQVTDAVWMITNRKNECVPRVPHPVKTLPGIPVFQRHFWHEERGTRSKCLCVHAFIRLSIMHRNTWLVVLVQNVGYASFILRNFSFQVLSPQIKEPDLQSQNGTLLPFQRHTDNMYTIPQPSKHDPSTTCSSSHSA